MSQGQIFWYGWKGLDTKKTHVKIKSPVPNGLEVIGNVKGYATDRQTNKQIYRQTNRQGKNYMPPITDCGGIKTTNKRFLDQNGEQR